MISGAAPAQASTPADLDPTFSADGKVVTDLGDRSYASVGTATAVDGQGRTVVAGRVSHGSRADIVVARYTAAGRLDTSFGGNGLVIRPSSGGIFEPTAVTVAGDGSIWVAAWTNHAVPLILGFVADTLLLRFSPTGEVLDSFEHDFGGDDRPRALSVSGGTVLLAGYARPRGVNLPWEPMGWDQDAYVARLDTSPLALDTGFSGDGVAYYDAGTEDDFSDEVALAVGPGANGTVLAGVAGATEATALRFTPGGAPDPTFSSDGIATRPNDGTWTTAATVDANKRVVVAGSGPGGMTAARFTAAGVPDSSYGDAGWGSVAGGAEVTGVVAGPDGAVTMSSGLTAARLTPAGDPDTSFGVSGLAAPPADPDAPGTGGVVLAADGGVRLSGTRTDPDDSSGGDDQPLDLALRMLSGTGLAVPGVGPAGITTLDVRLDGMDQARAVRVDAQGRLLVAGITQADPANQSDLFLARYTAAGAPDLSFGSDGVVTQDIDLLGLSTEDVRGLAIDSQGRIVVVATTYDLLQETGALVARFTPTGALDTGFDTGSGTPGVGVIAYDGPAHAVAVDPQDRILVAWTSYARATAPDVAVTRLLPTGATDTAFGDGGSATVDLQGFDRAGGIAVDASGRVLVSATPSNQQLAVVRLTGRGVLDTTFSTDGIATVPAPPSIAQVDARGLLVDGAKRPVVTAWTDHQVLLVRFTASGTPDPAFGTGGFADLPEGGNYRSVTAATFDGDRIVVAATRVSADDDIAVMRVLDDGSLDRGFNGTDGIATIDAGAFDEAAGVAVLASGRIVIAGSTHLAVDVPPVELPGIRGEPDYSDVLLVALRGGAPVAVPKTLTVTMTGTGGGGVTGPGIACPADCTETYADGTTVVLTATAQAGSAFTGWTGCDSVSGTQCTVTLAAARTVSAGFDLVGPTARTVSVTRSGSGGGRVIGPGIDCGSDCDEVFFDGAQVTLNALEDTDSDFLGWNGCDTVSGASCTVTVASDRTVTAMFDARGGANTLTVTKSGTGSGRVTDGTGAITCGATCHADYPSGASVTLTADPAAGSSLTGWSGCSSASGLHCTVAMDSARVVTAQFDADSAGTPPETSITRTLVNRRRHLVKVWFTGASASGTPTFECRRDLRPWAACSSPVVYRRVPAGRHTVQVRAVAGALVDETPARFRFRMR